MKPSIVPILFLALGLNISLTAQAPRLRIAFFDLPMVTTEKAVPNLGHGVVYDLLEAAAKEASLEFAPEFYPLKRAAALFEAGEIPFIYGSPQDVGPQSGLDQGVLGWVPSFTLRTSFYYERSRLEKPERFQKVEDLKGLTIGVIRGYFLVPFYRQAGLVVQEQDYPVSSFQMLELGRLDVLEMGDLSGNQILVTNFAGKGARFGTLSFSGIQMTGGPTYRKADTEAAALARRYEAGLKAIRDNGTYRQIIRRYWGSDDLPGYLFQF